uniref:Uncharacterized protein n=1 Tax=viral metagenome TaxID=1070528 RepID=A0A6C0LSS3_9ZZZZ
MFYAMPNQYMVVSAIDNSHIDEAYCMVSSLYSSNVNNVTLYQLSNLGHTVENILIQKHPYINIRTFNFNKYPAHVGISPVHDKGHYAWKPLIIQQMLHEYNNVIWLDSGTEIISHMAIDFMIAKASNYYGVYSMQSSGTIQDWTHHMMITYFKENTHISDVNIYRKNCHAAMLSFTNTVRVKYIIRLWVKCALDINCIEPSGASRANHRQDQSAFTIIIDYIEQRYNVQHGICIDDPHYAWHNGLHHRSCDKLSFFHKFLQLFT